LGAAPLYVALAAGFIALAAGFIALAAGLVALAAGFIALAAGFIALAAGFVALAGGLLAISNQLDIPLEFAPVRADQPQPFRSQLEAHAEPRAGPTARLGDPLQPIAHAAVGRKDNVVRVVDIIFLDAVTLVELELPQQLPSAVSGR